MVQTRLPVVRLARRKAPEPTEPDDDGDIVMPDHGETSSRPRRRLIKRQTIVTDSDDDDDGDDNGDNDSDKNNDEDEDIARVTKGTRMLMVAVEVPKRQTSLTSFFSPKSSNHIPLLPTNFTRENGKGKAVVQDKSKGKAVVGSSNSSKRQARRKVADSDGEDEFAPTEQSEVDSEYNEDTVAESDQEEEGSDEDLAAVYDSASEDEQVPTKKGKRLKAPSIDKKGAKKQTYRSKSMPCGIKIAPRKDQAGGLPPISNLSVVFDDIVSRVIPSIMKLMGPKKHRKLRVATMCSGTESPLLALGMFSKAIKERDLGYLEVEHVFSCEIEPYKQAYIERNFKPPILFRDIKELGGDFATTAYGAKVEVPGNVDILIAGTSCVDFSNLNNKQKSLEEGGESGDTFLGMMAWVTKHRPLIVIQENVCGAAWAEMRQYYKDRGYAAEYTRFDSKLYYIPHTRTRGYLCAVNLKGSDVPNKWLDAVKQMERKCTTTLEAFMLPDDDPRVYKARMELAGDPRRSGPIKARTVDWEKCEGRHQRERLDKKLGVQRPVTAWQEGGVCKMLDFMWQDWGRKQVERVLDLMDINFLLSVRDWKYDPMYKAAFWNLSQNVDRNTMGGKPDGISPCLTPHMIAYLCYRGGPMTGIEALHMQGLPIDELLLTRETSQQIQDLAGNAMSSTVVGTSMLCALILAMEHLPDRSSDNHMMIDEPEENIEAHVVGEDALEEQPLDLSTTVALDLQLLLIDAERSKRLCICEGRFSITDNKIRLCTECGFTACEKCGGRPSHVVPENQETPQFNDRLLPLEFESKLKSILPMRLRLSGIDISTLQELKNNWSALGESIAPSDWNIWCDLVLTAVEGEFRFKSLLRQEMWTVTYDAPHAKLELILNPKKPQWRIFAKCPEMEGFESRRRQLCETLPLARMFIKPGKSALDGQWELCLPVFSKLEISVQGIGEKVPSWQRTLGYMDSATMTTEVFNALRFEVPGEHGRKLDRDISGDYKLLQTCGTAQGALHMKVGSGDQPPLFCFIDQKRTGDHSEDSFVFSEDHRRLGYGEYRAIVAKTTSKWRQGNVRDEPRDVAVYVNGQWIPVNAQFGPPSASLSAKDGVVSIPGDKGLIFEVSNDDCGAARTVLQCKVPLRDQAESIWPKGKWVEVDSIHQRLTYESLAWLTERVRSLKQLEQWTPLEVPSCGLDSCFRCAPTPPQLKWFFIKNKFKAFEDPQEAAPYERALKSRPSPFITHIKLDENNIGTFKIGLNVATLVHRALFRMPAAGRGAPMLSWRLVTDYIPEPRLLLPFYNLTSNKDDPESVQPPNFLKKLRPEQLRSLTWMKQQEQKDINPFIEEEVAEALLPHLNWRAEGKAERPHYVRGGVLADEVGYGKTAITIGLIDSTQASINLPKEMPGAIPVKATLVVVPGHLSNQWIDEIRKFTGSKYKVVQVHSQGHLNKVTARDIMTADIVVVTAGLFQSAKYLSNLALFAGTSRAPSGQGRRFFDWQARALADLANQVNCLRDWGAAAVRDRIIEASRALERNEAAEVFVPKKRLVGSAYAASKAKPGAAGKRRRGSEGDSDESADISEGGSDRAKKARQSNVNQDPWNLRNHLVQRDWARMATPPFEMFNFNRLVVDEFTYLKGQIHAGITSQNANSRWVLSGTPPLDDFADVKTIADFLNIHLGIDDEGFGKEQNRRRIRKDMTGVELFTAFSHIHSPHWHTRRQQVAQAFLNQFVRQNFAEIDEIPCEEHIVPVELPAAERAIYLELEHYLQALDYNVQKSRAKVDNDRDRRQQEALGDSKTAEEALIKRCSHFDLDSSRSDEENAVHACDVIVGDRKTQLHSCREDIRRSLRDALLQYQQIPKKEWQDKAASKSNDKRPKDLFMEFVEQCRSVGVGDPDANHDIRILLDEAFAGKPFKVIYSDGSIANPKISASPKPIVKASKGKKGKTKEPKEVEEDITSPLALDTFEKIEQLKNKVIYLRGLVRKELAGRHRSLRYFTVVRDLQKSGIGDATPMKVTCPGCNKPNLDTSEIAVLSSCGHQGCYDCLEKAARLTNCLTAECQAATRALAVVRANSLGSEDKRDGIGRHHGKKLEKIVELINERIPVEEKVLLFVQFPDLMEKVAAILDESKIKYFKIQGTSNQQSTTVQQFQNDNSKTGIKVMLLNVTAESSSGANFTNANHAIFLSPLLTETEYLYKSSETQAIGRIRRYGQTRTVHIWRFMSADTMDVEIYERRTGERRDSMSFKSKTYRL